MSASGVSRTKMDIYNLNRINDGDGGVKSTSDYFQGLAENVRQDKAQSSTLEVHVPEYTNNVV